MKDLSDEHLMLQYQAGEETAFNKLYQRYHRRLYGYLRQKGWRDAELEELFQNVWIKLHQTRFRYDSQFRFAAWLFTLARNLSVDTWRKIKPFKNLSDCGLEKIPSPEAHPEKSSEVKVPWSTLSEEDQKSIEWRYFDEASFEEIAQRLNLTPMNVRQRISRALKKLRKTIQKEKL